MTRFSLKRATNSGGIAYTQAGFALDRVLTDEEHALIGKLTEQVKAYSRRAGFDNEESEPNPLFEARANDTAQPLL